MPGPGGAPGADGLTEFSHVRVFEGHGFLPGARDVRITGGRVVELSSHGRSGVGALRRGGVLVPGFVDGHVHLALADPMAVAKGGVTSVLDLGAPEGLAFAHGWGAPLTVRSSGPILTAPGGYPTESWGADGFGLTLRHPDRVSSEVARLAHAGAALIKVSIAPERGPALPLDTLRALCAAAQREGLVVAAHAMTVDAVGQAVAAGVGVLAHCPVEALPTELVDVCASAGVTVISTVGAFGGSASTKANLMALARSGCAVVYGTDLGNEAVRPGLDPIELDLLAGALGSLSAALVSATSGAAQLAGLPDRGRIYEGGPADLIWLPGLDSAEDLAHEDRVVMLDGVVLTANDR